MMSEQDALDIKSETEDLTADEIDRLKHIRNEMTKIWIKEETKAKQRSRDIEIKEGDRNTAYFTVVANQRRRKTRINSLQGTSGPTSDTQEMLDIAANFYKNLLSKEDNSSFSMSDDFFSDQDKFTTDENDLLSAPFTEAGIKKQFLILIQMELQALMAFLSSSIRSSGI